MPVINRAIVYLKTPDGIPIPGQDLAIVDQEPFDVDQDAPTEGFSAQTLYISFDPAMRLHMKTPEESKVFAPYEFNRPVTNRLIARVLARGATASHEFHPGDLIFGYGQLQEYLRVEDAKKAYFQKLPDNPLGLDQKLFLAALGPPGLVAYASFYKLCKPVKGETLLVSGASGAVGQTVGQLAIREGLHVIGVVGSEEKAAKLRELGFHGILNYKEPGLTQHLKEMAPQGINIYYDNVGGVVLEAAIESMADSGRIIACGFASQYNTGSDDQYGIRNTGLMVAKNLQWQGFSTTPGCWVFDYADEHQENLQKWIHDGSFKPVMSVTTGLDKALDSFSEMLQGKHVGKAIVDLTSK